MRGKDVRQDPSPTSKEEQQNGPVTGPVRGGFALRKGNMVTRKALVRPVSRERLISGDARKLCDKSRTALFFLAYE